MNNQVGFKQYSWIFPSGHTFLHLMTRKDMVEAFESLPPESMRIALMTYLDWKAEMTKRTESFNNQFWGKINE